MPAVTIRDLCATLRHRPDRIVLGEVRGEGMPFKRSTPATAARSTIHANSATQALARRRRVLQSGIDLPYQPVRRMIATRCT